MNIQANSSAQIIQFSKPITLRILVSYYYLQSGKSLLNRLKRLKEELGENLTILLDSGAFSAYSLKKEISISSYKSFLKEHKELFWRCFTLDVVGDQERTWNNFFELKDAGFDVIPIYTRKSNFDELEKCYEYSDYVGIGGIFSFEGSNFLHTYLKPLTEKLQGRKCHWLGVTNINHVIKYRPYSVDSSNFAGAQRWGGITFLQNFVTASSVHKGMGKGSQKNEDSASFLSLQKLSKPEYLSDFTLRLYSATESKGVDPAKLFDHESWRTQHAFSSKITIRSHLEQGLLVEWILGTKVFHALTGSRFIDDSLQALQQIHDFENHYLERNL
ncbi:hypothetical protein C4561_01685 [candidate division WWE3 bacterium]|uniref:Uncharacterized protein n=1 Tax=candidate division WWE3 bacterium TaxID=2053526 RepID=A0A3A4ZLR7_UNCKA|nr:MAG: hypothetical protein C4561_01685 [candidate division WWE3 bacterium]